MNTPEVLSTEDEIRVLRIIEYRGPRSWVEKTIANSIHGTRFVEPNKTISANTLGLFPEILTSKEVGPK